MGGAPTHSGNVTRATRFHAPWARTPHQSYP